MIENLKFDFDDIMIPPAPMSDFFESSRKHLNIKDENGMLPLFAAPMDTVVDENNNRYFNDNGIYTILPRQSTPPIPSRDKFHWTSYGLTEFREIFLNSKYPAYEPLYVLIDIANGHMKLLHDTIKEAKEHYKDKLILMVGNIANPLTFKLLSDAGADYIRLGIGAGSGCLTSEQTAVNYPMASLIKETYDIASTMPNPAKIVADGGFKKYSDIIKGFVLGADYVMLGGMMNKCLESCADTFKANIKHDTWTEPGAEINQYSDITKKTFENGTRYFKKFRGMSTKSAQVSLGNKVIKTSEGITRMNEVEYTVGGWVENFTHYFKTTMSYTNKTNLNELIGLTEFIFITPSAFKRFTK